MDMSLFARGRSGPRSCWAPVLRIFGLRILSDEGHPNSAAVGLGEGELGFNCTVPAELREGGPGLVQNGACRPWQPRITSTERAKSLCSLPASAMTAFADRW